MNGIFSVHRAWIDHLLQRLETTYKDSHWISATMTLRQGRTRDDGTVETLTYAEVTKAIKFFLKSLNKKVFKGAYRKHKKRLAVIPSIEESKAGRLHVHMTLQVPKRMRDAPEDFFRLVESEWGKLSWSMPVKKLPLLKHISTSCVGRSIS
jgi:hypothetical protein